MTAPKPLLLERKVLPKVWGGRALERVPGIALPPGEPVGETWELFDRPDGSSSFRGSETTLRQLMERHGPALLGRRGRASHGGRFPLLLKFLDASDALSLQVHPDDARAAADGDGGKTEAWVVLEVGERGRIVRGFREGVTREQFAAVAGTPAVEPLLCSFRPEIGDCIFVPAGTVHAVGPDVAVFEVQQNSDLTWRLYDWGRPREVHVEKALAVAEVHCGEGQERVTPRRLPDGGEELLRAPQFRLRRYRLEHRATWDTDDGFLIVTVLRGRGMLGWHSGGDDAPLPLAPGDSVLVPAATPQVFVSPIGTLEVLLTDPGI